MRITGGLWASRKVLGPGKNLPLRPTPAALRQQAFAILEKELAGAVFLDLFAGTGILSLEALSRGAAAAWLVEANPKARQLIARNLALLGVDQGQVRLLPLEAAQAVRRLAQQGIKVHIAWADPPFAHFSSALPVLAALVELEVLVPGGALVVECPPKAHIALAGLECIRTLRGGLLFRRLP